MNDRLSSAEPGLDGILGGGLPANAITMIVGPPGSGKTIMAEQYAFHNATPERPALFLATVSEPRDKMIRYGQTMSFFDAEAIGTRIFYEDLGRPLREQGLQGVLEAVTALTREHRPGLVVIDSFKALEAFGEGDHFRHFLHDLAGHLTALRASALWIGEYTEDALADAPAFAVADAIISLSAPHDGLRRTRLLQVLKLRGSDFASGQHAYRLSAEGIRVFPRLADVVPVPYAPEPRRIASGVDALDAMLEDGYWAGTATLLTGPSGSGKTVMGMSFICAGAAAGEPSIVATLQESPAQLTRALEPLGMSLEDPGVKLLYHSPVDLYLEEWLAELLELILSTGAKRVLVDSLGDLRLGTADPMRFREYLYSLLQHCAQNGVSLMMTLEVAPGAPPGSAIEYGVSNLSDNVVMLDLVREGPELKRTITIAKTRGSGHDPNVRELAISSDGVYVGDPVSMLAS